MKLFDKKWRVALVVVAVIAASGFVIEHFAGINPIGAAVNSVLSPIKNGFSYIAQSIGSGIDFVWEMRAYKEDNEKLASANADLKRRNRDVEAYREENERLQELLELKNSLDSLDTVAARVISYSGTNNCELIELGKGTLSGIAEGDTVITPDGVVGKVTEAGPAYSIVKTILAPSAAVGIRVTRTGGTGLAEGDDDLAKEQQCKVSFLDRTTTMIVGDQIETSGSGGIYPPGLAVGSIVSISADSSGGLNHAVVEPAVDIDRLGEVLVIKGN